MNGHYYGVFGLTMYSDRPLPGLAANAVAPVCGPDVSIIRGSAPIPTDVTTIDDDIHAAPLPDGVALIVRDVGAFAVRRGETVVVDPAPGATDHEVEVYVLGTVMVAILLQRGLVPLHSNGVVVDGKAFLVCGESGAGKSTAAACFQAEGLPLMADDVCALATDRTGRIVVLPGIRRLKLWNDTIERFGLGAGRTRPVPWTAGEKFEVIARSYPALDAAPLGGIFHLDWGDVDGAASIERIPGPQAVAVIASNLHRRRIADLIGMSRTYMDLCGRIAGDIPVLRVLRGDDAWRIEETARSMIRRMRRIAADGGGAPGNPATGEA